MRLSPHIIKNLGVHRLAGRDAESRYLFRRNSVPYRFPVSQPDDVHLSAVNFLGGFQQMKTVLHAEHHVSVRSVNLHFLAVLAKRQSAWSAAVGYLAVLHGTQTELRSHLMNLLRSAVGGFCITACIAVHSRHADISVLVNEGVYLSFQFYGERTCLILLLRQITELCGDACRHSVS